MTLINTNFNCIDETYTATLERDYKSNQMYFTLINNTSGNKQDVSSEYNAYTWNELVKIYGLKEAA
jgi:hypothetical protein